MEPLNTGITDAMREKINQEITQVYTKVVQILMEVGNRMPDTQEGIGAEKIITLAIASNLITECTRTYAGDRLYFLEQLLEGMKKLIINSLMDGQRLDEKS